MKVFIDSGGWLSVLVESDQYHRVGREYFEALIALKATAVTSDYVLDEVITRLRYDAGHAQAVTFLRLIHQARNASILSVRPITETLREEAEALFITYSDSCLSFTDCTSFALLRREPVDEVFGFDSHFEMMGFLLQPKP